MDGVLVHEGIMVPGADRFVALLAEKGRSFLVLTNNSMFTPRDLCDRLAQSGLVIPEASLWTSALATAQFLDSQRPNGKAYVIGEAGLTTALHDIGYVLTDRHPSTSCSRDEDLQLRGHHQGHPAGGRRGPLHRHQPRPGRPEPQGILPACGSVAALISHATGVAPYFVGKPNSLMVREGLNTLGAHSESTVMVGDRMDTDVVAGIEAGLQTILVLSGVTAKEQIDRFPYRPSRVIDSVADLIGELEDLEALQ